MSPRPEPPSRDHRDPLRALAEAVERAGRTVADPGGRRRARTRRFTRGGRGSDALPLEALRRELRARRGASTPTRR